MIESILWIQFLASYWMMVVILFVQITHYPLFRFVAEPDRKTYCLNHQRSITFMVVPSMLIELFSLCYIIFLNPKDMFWIGMLVLLGLIWLSTFFIQVPYHNALLKQPTDHVIKKLVQSNWIRTVLWSIKTLAIGGYMLL